MRHGVWFLLLFFLGGCSTFSNIEKGLDYLHGKKIESAVSALGAPNKASQYGSTRFYQWNTAFSTTLTTLQPQTSYSSGLIGSTSYIGSTTHYEPQTNTFNHYCSIRIETDLRNVINKATYDGNLGGCEKYSRLLSRIIPNDVQPKLQKTSATPTSIPSQKINNMKISNKKKVLISPGAGWKKIDKNSNEKQIQFLNETYDAGLLFSITDRKNILDFDAYTKTIQGNQLSRLKKPSTTEIKHISINGYDAAQFNVTGEIDSGLLLTYLVSVIEGPNYIGVLNNWVLATNFEYSKPMLEKLPMTISGL